MRIPTDWPEIPTARTDRDLIAKYGEAVPRYTSYPPANRFQEAEMDPALAADLCASERPLSLYLHVPFCAQRCYFCGCNTELRRQYGDTPRYVEGLILEMERWAQALGASRKVVDIHWGGGTPTFLKPSDIRRLGKALHRSFRLADGFHFSVEIDPRHLSAEQAAALAEIGCNRASLGIQDTDPMVQAAINRLQPMSVNRAAVALLQEAGISELNVDLIYGLPFQTEHSFARTLEAVLELDPDRLAVFGYAHLPEVIPVQRVIERRGGLPDPELRLTLMELAIERLTAAGYQHLGLDHFAKPTDRLAQAAHTGELHRNFNGYTDQPTSDLLGFGPSAISEGAHVYAQNEKTPTRWLAAIENGEATRHRGLHLSTEDAVRRELIRAVLSRPRFQRTSWIIRYGPIAKAIIESAMATMDDLAADGLIIRYPDGFELTAAGRLFSRAVAHRFDAHYHAPRPTQRHAPAI